MYVRCAGRKRYLRPDEFMNIFATMDVFTETFGKTDLLALWNMAMMTRADEVGASRHLHMNFSEFIEAVCRVADKLSGDESLPVKIERLLQDMGNSYLKGSDHMQLIKQRMTQMKARQVLAININVNTDPWKELSFEKSFEL